MPEPFSIPRPKRWDVPFWQDGAGCEEMSDEEVVRILSISPFSDLDETKFRKTLQLKDILKNDVRIRKCTSGEILVRKDDWGDTAFFVLSGAVYVDLNSEGKSISDSLTASKPRKKKSFFQSVAQLWKNNQEPEFRDKSKLQNSAVRKTNSHVPSQLVLQDIPAVLDEYQTARIEQGHWFGELAALGRTARTATVFAEEETEVLEIRWQGLRDIMRFDKDGRLKQYLENVFREHALASFLRNEPLFENLSDQKMEQVLFQVKFESYGDYDSPQPFKKLAEKGSRNEVFEPVIAAEGEKSAGLVLIRNGVARISKTIHNGERTVGYLTPGQSFGLEDILDSSKSPKEILNSHSIKAIGYLNVVVVPIEVVRDVLSFSGNESVSKVEEASLPDENLLDYLVDHSFVQGTSTMAIDLSRCTRCDDCVKACAKTHDNNPRFIRHGPISNGIMFANACLHCADPVCMIECPTGAIHRDQKEGLVVISEETCIGCAQCANNCPFDAIRMVEIRDEKGQFILDDARSKPLTQATKCDLCIDLNHGPACQSACPHDALFRVDMQNYESLGHALES